jgi:hypothetical protein
VPFRIGRSDTIRDIDQHGRHTNIRPNRNVILVGIRRILRIRLMMTVMATMTTTTNVVGPMTRIPLSSHGQEFHFFEMGNVSRNFNLFFFVFRGRR